MAEMLIDVLIMFMEKACILTEFLSLQADLKHQVAQE